MPIERISHFVPTTKGPKHDLFNSHDAPEQHDESRVVFSRAAHSHAPQDNGHCAPLPPLSRKTRHRGTSTISATQAEDDCSSTIYMECEPWVSPSDAYQMELLYISTLAIGALPGPSSVLESLIVDLYANHTEEYYQEACPAEHVIVDSDDGQGYEADDDHSSAGSWETVSEVDVHDQ